MEQTLHVNPTKEDRKPTNVLFVGALGLIFFIWLAIGIKVIAEKQEDDEIANYQTIFHLIDGIKLRFTWKYPISTILSILIGIGYVYFLSLSIRSKFIIDGAMYLLCIWMLLVLIGNSILSSLFFENIIVHLGFIFYVTYAAYMVMSFRCARSIGTKPIFEIIKDSCRLITSYSAVPLFLFAVSVFIALLAYFTVYILYRMWSTVTLDNIRSVMIYSSIHGFCGVALISFFVNFIHIVVSGFAIDWYWMRDQQLNSYTIIKCSITRTFRYHLGTLAFSCIPLLSYICSVYQVFRPNESDNDTSKIYKSLTRFFSQVCVFFYIVDFALIQTSIYGYDYMTAIVAAQDLAARSNRELNIAVCEVSRMVAAIGYILMAIPFFIDRIQSAMYSIIIPFSIVFTSAVHALLVNKMIIDCKTETIKKDHESAQKVVPRETEQKLTCDVPVKNPNVRHSM